jgi:beta-xylosidase
MKIVQVCFAVFACLYFSACGQKREQANATIEKTTDILLADPTVFLYDGVYYLYGTDGTADFGFPVYESDDLITWRIPKTPASGFALKKGDAFGRYGFWAPQVFSYKHKFYMAYTAEEQIAIAVSDHPAGPFVQKEIRCLTSDVKQIDPYVFFDDDGRIYLYHVRLDKGNRIYVAEMLPDLSGIKTETLTACVSAEKGWEDTQSVDWTVVEGPTVVKKAGLYYLFYSANDFRNIDYAVGYAVSESPYGPWRKGENNPIISRHLLDKPGTGHGDLFQDTSGNWNYVFHVHASDSTVIPRKTGIVPLKWDDDANTVSAVSSSCFYPVLDVSNASVYQNPLAVEFGDPYVLLASDGHYYMYGTGAGAVDGFCAYSSTDLVNWKSEGQVYRGNVPGSWAVANFWAPEVYERNGKFYLFFSADWKENPTNELENFRIGVAVSDKATGPFKEMSDRPLFDPGYPAIDGNIFVDEDGRTYLYYSRCCYKHAVESEVADWAKKQGLFEEIEESWIYGVEIKPDFSQIIGEPVLILRPPVTNDDAQAEWESRSVTSGEVNRRWTEGSFTIRQGDTYYMMYSANYFGGENYAVGYATAKSPLGPFTKSADNPVLQKNSTKGGVVTGTGHNSIVRSRDGQQMYCVYHGRTKATGEERVVFIDRMGINEQGRLFVDGPTTTTRIIRP